MSSVHHIVAKVEQKAEQGELVITDEIRVAVKVEDAVNRIGAWNGDLFAVWSFPGRPSSAEVADCVGAHPPESLWVISGDWPFELQDRYLELVRRPGRD